MTAYLVSIVIELPFVNSGFFVGPFVKPLGGADISWILGIFVSGGLYLLLMRLAPIRRGHDSRNGDAPVGEIGESPARPANALEDEVAEA